MYKILPASQGQARMSGRVVAMLWAGGATFMYAVLFLLFPVSAEYGISVLGISGLKWTLTIGYSLFGLVLLAAMARLLPDQSFHWLRMLMVLFGAMLAIIQCAGFGLRLGLSVCTEFWLAAVLGLAVAAVSIRVVPARYGRRLLGRERREHF